MIKALVFFAVLFFIVACWLWFLCSSLNDENDRLTAENNRLDDENKLLKERGIKDSINQKTSAYNRDYAAIKVDEDGVPVDMRWKL